MTAARKKVLFVLAGLGGGGAERVMVTILRHLDRSRFEPHLALVEATGPLLEDVPEDVPVYDLKAHRARYCVPAIVRLTWKVRPDVILSTLGYLNLMLIFAKPLLPGKTKLFVREGISVTAYLEIDGKYPKLWKWLYHHFYKKADKIICQSNYMLNDLEERFGVPRGKMVRIYNPVDIQRIRKLADAHENPYPGDGPQLVTAGRLTYQKGIDLLLDALVVVRKAFPNVKLTILGQGELETELKTQCDRLGLGQAVHFLGFQSNPFPSFKHADIFLQCSRYEGLSNVVLEALALGTLVVAMDCPGGSREIADNNDGLTLVESNNAVSFAKAIVKALSENTSTRLKAGYPAFMERFCVKTVVAQYESMLEGVVRPRMS